MIQLLLTFFFFLTANLYSEQYNLSAVCISQNEAPYLREWIDYHKKVGVEHFWIYDNNSSENYHMVLQDYIEQGLVELIDWPSVQEENDWWHFSFVVQTGAYNDAIQRAKKKSKWLAIIDTDEFIVPLKHDSIPKALKQFTQDPGLYIKWRCFGTSYVTLENGQSILENLIYCSLPDHHRNSYRKSIVKPNMVSHCPNPHFCHYYKGTHRQDQKVDKLFRINHYWTRDEKFFQEVKVPRYEKWGGKKEDLLKENESLNMTEDTEIQRFLPL